MTGAPEQSCEAPQARTAELQSWKGWTWALLLRLVPPPEHLPHIMSTHRLPSSCDYRIEQILSSHKEPMGDASSATSRSSRQDWTIGATRVVADTSLQRLTLSACLFSWRSSSANTGIAPSFGTFSILTFGSVGRSPDETVSTNHSAPFSRAGIASTGKSTEITVFNRMT